MNAKRDGLPRLLALALCGWLSSRTRHPATLVDDVQQLESDLRLFSVSLDLGGSRLAAAVALLPQDAANDPWNSPRLQLQERIAAEVPAGTLVWIPPEAPLPEYEPNASEFVHAVGEAARHVDPAGLAEVRIPASLYLKRIEEDGNYMSATGGLAPLWARWTDRIRGVYSLDSRAIRRLPSGDEERDRVIDLVAEHASRLAIGQLVKLEADEAWTVQLVGGKPAAGIVGLPETHEPVAGAPLRRDLRRAVPAAAEALRRQDAAGRVLLVASPATYLSEETTSTALRGFDPALYAGIDLVLVAADGRARTAIDLRTSAALTALAAS